MDWLSALYIGKRRDEELLLSNADLIVRISVSWWQYGVCHLFATPIPPLCYPGSTSLPPRIPRYQRGSKEVPKRRQRGKNGVSSGTSECFIVFPWTNCCSSQVFPKPVTTRLKHRHIFEKTASAAVYICFISHWQRSFSRRATGKREPGNPLPVRRLVK